jgi:antitoxin component YwqK of YwqJK toxin-antitoxin module
MRKFVYYMVIKQLQTLLLVFALVAGGTVLAQPKPGSDLNLTDAQGWKQGKWVKRDKNNKVVYEGTFKDDKPTGYFKYLHPDGALKAEMVFSDNGTVSRAKLYSQTGKLMAQGKFVNEKKDSTWKFFTELGWVINEENYKAGKKNGPSKTFFKNGTLAAEHQYTDDKKNGPVKEYYEDGSPKMTGTFVNDFLDGKAVYYYPGNYKSAEGVYVKGVKDGIWRHYTEKGEPESQFVYKSGTVVKKQIDNGIQEEFFPGEIPKAQYTIKNSKKNGPFVEFHPGAKKEIKPFVNEEGVEEMKEVLVGQKVKCKGNYKDGKLEGTVTWFGTDGKVEKTEEYKDGQLVTAPRDKK